METEQGGPWIFFYRIQEEFERGGFFRRRREISILEVYIYKPFLNFEFWPDGIRM